MLPLHRTLPILIAAPSLLLAAQHAAAPPIAVQPVPLTTPLLSVLAARRPSYTITVPGTGAWTDAGVTVAPGDHLDITATGTMTLPDGRACDPTGLAKGWKDLLRGFPAPAANTCALVARIGSAEAAVPFVAGSLWQQDVAAPGELYFAVNVGETLAGTGAFTVTVKLSKAAAPIPVAPAIDMESVLTPGMFAAIPRRVTDQQGDPGDAVNFALLGRETDVKKAFTAAGWIAVDKSTNQAVLHGLMATLSRQSYTAMPMSTLYLFGRPQDLSYARADPLVVALERHHLRLWSTGLTVAGEPLWVGSATHDDGLERDQRDNGVTHHIDPDIDVERDFIQKSFAASGVLAAAAYVSPADPVHSSSTATGGNFTTEGRILVMALR